MPDRVKEAIFSMLGALFVHPGALPPFRVADVFAGSGTMGLESLSRGAAFCTFFERGRQALDALHENITALEANVDSTVITRDAWRAATHDANERAFDLLFLDPPYADSMDTSPLGAVPRYLSRVKSQADAPLIVFHHPASVDVSPETIAPWRVIERRTFGTNGITLLKP